MPRTFSRDDSSIRVRAGEPFSVVVDVNPSTGYEWTGSVRGAAIELRDVRLTPATGKLGAAGRQTFELVAKHAGRATLSLSLARSWEKAQPIESIQFDVEVAE